ncbi:hypothetical protein PPACK8108_LOCUS21441 [Phakopsora pachyrhizi]|uniref:DDE Tnp4 domain-containing protein n=1 Tax=Phakopsora pachyrhizi TaxID=170000 RepID=A0AAV0BJY2_PHAPC|nr:hypothetical protein PPACK8108_LOCUS21441 [Phakopsora pachyrhizi]
MDITINSNSYFGPGEYLLAYSAYPSTSTLVPACRVSNCSTAAKTEFNKRLARNQLRTPKKKEYLTQWVLACVVLHNLLENIGDKWEELFNDEEACKPERAGPREHVKSAPTLIRLLSSNFGAILLGNQLQC